MVLFTHGVKKRSKLPLTKIATLTVRINETLNFPLYYIDNWHMGTGFSATIGHWAHSHLIFGQLVIWTEKFNNGLCTIAWTEKFT